MRVVMIIPAVFGYFTIIRDNAFRLAEQLKEEGVEVVPFTLQIGKPNRRTQAAVRDGGNSGRQTFSFEATVSFDSLREALAEADLVHLHAPFLGFGKELLKFKQHFLTVPLVISWYGELVRTDLFSWYIQAYNRWYLARLGPLADGVMIFGSVDYTKDFQQRYFPGLTILTQGSDEVQLRERALKAPTLAQSYIQSIVPQQGECLFLI